jgi:non-ribosomal peptide synthetase component F
MDVHLHRHVLVMNHDHPRDISSDPRSLELILLPLRQKVVDGVLGLVMMGVVIGGDRLPCSVNYRILVSHSESWTHVLSNHIGPTEDLHNCHVLFPP